MSRYSDAAPIKNTCPIIDEVISKMELAKSEAEYIHKNPEENHEGEAVTILYELSDAIFTIEKVREANSTLRDWGNDEYIRAEELDKENSNLANKVTELEDEVENLKSYLEKIEN